jgi:hypothetical protein
MNCRPQHYLTLLLLHPDDESSPVVLVHSCQSCPGGADCDSSHWGASTAQMTDVWIRGHESGCAGRETIEGKPVPCVPVSGVEDTTRVVDVGCHTAAKRRPGKGSCARNQLPGRESDAVDDL